MTGLSALILATLAYSDIFDYPLTAKEISRWLVGSTNWDNKDKSKLADVSLSNIETELKLLLQAKKVESYRVTKTIFYFLPGRQSIINIRKICLHYSKDKWQIAQKAALVLRRLGWIKMVGVTGALAMDNCQEGDDVDLLIITSKGRLWLTRPLAILALRLSGLKVRRYGDTNVKNKLCPNMFIEEGDFLIKQHNLYTAHEVAQTKPIVNKNGSFGLFIKTNSWVSNYLPNSRLSYGEKKPSRRRCLVNILTSLLTLLNRFAYRLQCRYMNLKRTNETITLSQVYFHPEMLSDKIKNSFLTRLTTINRIAVGRIE